MAGATGWTPTPDAFDPAPQIDAVYAHIDAKFATPVASPGSLPSSGNWPGRTLMAESTKTFYQCTALPGTWQAITSPSFGLARRTTAPLSSGNNAYADISADAAWSPELAGGMTYDNGFVVAVDGVYVVEWSILPSSAVSGIAGIVVGSGTPNGAILHAPGTLMNAGAVIGSASAMVRINAGQKVKLWCFGNAGTITFTTVANQPSTHWGLRWIGA